MLKTVRNGDKALIQALDGDCDVLDLRRLVNGRIVQHEK